MFPITLYSVSPEKPHGCRDINNKTRSAKQPEVKFTLINEPVSLTQKWEKLNCVLTIG